MRAIQKDKSGETISIFDTVDMSRVQACKAMLRFVRDCLSDKQTNTITIEIAGFDILFGSDRGRN